ncbi:MAG: 4Fe-4S dicluster domain-containing protein [Candidatus Cryosericum sp.]
MSHFEDGIIDTAYLRENGFLPSEERQKKGPVAVIECIQEIPCNPCVSACKFDAISMEGINGIPHVDFAKCTGCMSCLKVCPGLAIFIQDKSKARPSVTIPYEYLPLPAKGDAVTLLGRDGAALGVGTVKFVLRADAISKSSLISVEFDDPALCEQVRNIKVR